MRHLILRGFRNQTVQSLCASLPSQEREGREVGRRRGGERKSWGWTRGKRQRGSGLFDFWAWGKSKRVLRRFSCFLGSFGSHWVSLHSFEHLHGLPLLPPQAVAA